MSMGDRKLKWRLWRFVILMLMQIYLKLSNRIYPRLKNEYTKLVTEIDFKISEDKEDDK